MRLLLSILAVFALLLAGAASFWWLGGPDTHRWVARRALELATGREVQVDGTLEIKGNRAPVALTGTITDPVADPWGNSKLGLSLEGSVDKNAVGLTWNAPLPEGGSMLADEVALDASLVFVQTGGNENR